MALLVASQEGRTLLVVQVVAVELVALVVVQAAAAKLEAVVALAALVVVQAAAAMLEALEEVARVEVASVATKTTIQMMTLTNAERRILLPSH